MMLNTIKKVGMILFVAATAIILTACSDTPSDRDARRAVRRITGNCQYFTVTHVLKVNWPLPGTADYQVDIQYSLLVSALPEAGKVTAAGAAQVAALDAQLAAAGLERDRNFKANADFLDRIAKAQRAGDEVLAVSVENERAAFGIQKLEPSTRLARKRMIERSDAIAQTTKPLHDALMTACPKTTEDTYKKLYEDAGLDQFVQGHTMDFATSVRMTRAGKGWELVNN